MRTRVEVSYRRHILMGLRTCLTLGFVPISVWEALRDAAASAKGGQAVHMDAPATAESVLKALKA